MIPFSVLDLSPITLGSTAAQSLKNTLSLAQLAERRGYQRYWLAEHHSMTGIASAATAVVIGHVAAGTSTIRVGSGGIMLPNHAPLVIAEQCGTLASLVPGRIDLGLGRAPGTDQRTARALRRNMTGSDESFPQDVMELKSYFEPFTDGQGVRAVPGEGLRVPMWLLGSSLFSAHLAARLGLPFAFASHFAPDFLLQALDVYRSNFAPSEQLEKPHAMVGVNVFAADTDSQAARLFTTLQQQFLNMRRGTRGQLPPPVDSMDTVWTPSEKVNVERALAVSVVGGPETVRHGLSSLIRQTDADELMITAQCFDHQARLHSFDIAADVREQLAQTLANPAFT